MKTTKSFTLAHFYLDYGRGATDSKLGISNLEALAQTFLAKMASAASAMSFRRRPTRSLMSDLVKG